MPDAAAALVVDTANRVLLIREGHGAGRYGLPGGVIEPGETPRDAATREVLEELGVTVEPRELVAVYHLRTDRSEGLRFFFRCDVISGRPSAPESGEIAGFVWASTASYRTHSRPRLRKRLRTWQQGVKGSTKR